MDCYLFCYGFAVLDSFLVKSYNKRDHLLFSLIFVFIVSQFLFKKYLKFEKSLGEDNERIQHVQQKAMQYVESSLPSQSQ
jgi:hypothetical protein